jgi:peroxiredoxin Q/BCP
MSDIAVGDQVPEFNMPVTGGGTISNSDFAGIAWVLYFYPKDDTPGCTKEAIGFTEHLAQFEEAGLRILGVSKDTLAKHEKFIAKHDLGIPLAADDGDFCERIGVWVEKKMYGKTYMGIERATFLIGADETVKEIWRKVKVPGHVEAVLEAARGL